MMRVFGSQSKTFNKHSVSEFDLAHKESNLLGTGTVTVNIVQFNRCSEVQSLLKSRQHFIVLVCSLRIKLHIQPDINRRAKPRFTTHTPPGHSAGRCSVNFVLFRTYPNIACDYKLQVRHALINLKKYLSLGKLMVV